MDVGELRWGDVGDFTEARLFNELGPKKPDGGGEKCKDLAGSELQMFSDVFAMNLKWIL